MDVLLSCLAVRDQLVVDPQTYYVVRRVPLYSCRSLENLELMTKAEHNQLHFSGSGSGNSKLTEKDVREIRGIAENTDRTKTSIANEFDISLSQASKIIERDAWKHID